MKAANFAPVYACIYPQLAEVARSHGYALAIHGSLARDFDLICIPWAECVSDPQSVVDEITSSFAIQQVGGFEQKEHGRIAYTISLSFGDCAIDLSFVPSPAQPVKPGLTKEAARCSFVMRSVAALEADEIDGDTLDLRFEDGEGRDTGRDVSIVEYAERTANVIDELLGQRQPERSADDQCTTAGGRRP